jgi:hypothetical protein
VEHQSDVVSPLGLTCAYILTNTSGIAWLFELIGGEIRRPEGSDDCIPKKNRDAMWNIVAFHQWGELDEVKAEQTEEPRYDNAEDEECVRSADAVRWILGHPMIRLIFERNSGSRKI